MKIGLPLLTLLSPLNIGTSSILRSPAYTNETSRVYDIFMNFCVVLREIREVNKRGGGQNKLRGSPKIPKKYPPTPTFILNLKVELCF